MKKQLKSSGNGWLLYFTKPLLKLCGYNPAITKVLFTTKNKTLFITPVDTNDLEKYENNMVRGFQKNGCSHGLYFPNTVLEVLEVDPETDLLDIDIDENKLIIKKAQ
ncbi:MAG: hypothetical protein ACLSWI_02675 [Candidatus Gastranaerophilaceae bacterium]